VMIVKRYYFLNSVWCHEWCRNDTCIIELNALVSL